MKCFDSAVVQWAVFIWSVDWLRKHLRGYYSTVAYWSTLAASLCITVYIVRAGTLVVIIKETARTKIVVLRLGNSVKPIVRARYKA